MINVLVYGWYGNGNVGDELFADAFKILFPDYNFTFVQQITVDSLEGQDAVFFGGGSFVYDEPKISPEALVLLDGYKLFYIGIGIEGTISNTHKALMAKAKAVAIRSGKFLTSIQAINPNAELIPDLVFALKNNVSFSQKPGRSVLIMPNIEVVPRASDPHWKHSSWEYFKSEFSQFLDSLIERKFTLNFFSMCQNDTMNDHWAATEIINKMKYRSAHYQITDSPLDFEGITSLISQHNFVISQRFHGLVLAQLCRVPFLSLYHHDKLKDCPPNEGKFLSYYGSFKQALTDNFNWAYNMKFPATLPIEDNIFRDFAFKVSNIISGG